MNNLINERIILDCSIMSKSLIHKIVERVIPEYFYDLKYRTLFKVIVYLYKNKIEISLSSIYKYLVDQKKLDEFKDVVLSVLQSWNGGDIDHYIDSLIDDYNRRKLELSLKRIAEALNDKSNSVDDLCQKADRDLKSIIQNSNSSVMSFKDMATGKVEDLSNHNRYYRTGFKDYDHLAHGIYQTELIILASRPGVGKSSLAINIGWNIVERYKSETGLFFSLEMAKEELRLRSISQKAKIDSYVIQNESYNSDQLFKITEAMDYVDTITNFKIIDNELTLSKILTTSQRISRMEKLSFIMIDYLQIISHRVKGATENERLAEITRELKLLAKELCVPIVLLSQLNREVEQRSNRRPQPSDLRSSGAIEQDANVVWFLYQDKEAVEKKEIDKNLYYWETAKNRNGKKDFTNELLFQPEYTQFIDF